MQYSINLSFVEWPNAYGDKKMTTALLGLIETGNDSYRFKSSTSNQEKVPNKKTRSKP